MTVTFNVYFRPKMIYELLKSFFFTMTVVRDTIRAVQRTCQIVISLDERND